MLTLQPKWYHLESRRTGKKKSVVTGEVQLQFHIYDPIHLSATPNQILEKITGLTVMTPGSMDGEEDEEDPMERTTSHETGDDEDEDTSDETDEVHMPEEREEKKKKRRLARLKRKTKERTYEFSGASSVAGVLFLEITKITDLPPEKNCKFTHSVRESVPYTQCLAVTRTSFDMDPFVVTSLGRKTFRTKVIRHNLNPVYEDKLVFQVQRHEVKYSMQFTIVDRDKLSGNDFVGTAMFPLDGVISVAPESDPNTGLYRLHEIPDVNAATPGTAKKRFRLPLSRTSSATSLGRNSRPTLQGQLKRSSSNNSLNGSNRNLDLPEPPTSAPSDSGSNHSQTSGLYRQESANGNGQDDPDLRPYDLPIDLKNRERWEAKHNPVLHIKAKYLPYQALRQQFWRAMLKQYDADDSGTLTKVEFTTMLDTLGSTLHESTIDGFFKRFEDQNSREDWYLTIDQAVMCLEDELKKHQDRMGGKTMADRLRHRFANVHGSHPNTSGDTTPTEAPSRDPMGLNFPMNNDANTSVIPAVEPDYMGQEGEEGDILDQDDLADDTSGEEHVVEIRECPICHQPRLNKKSDADIVTHIATCASQDWRQVNNIVMAGFVTSSQAQRKWYSKIITKIGYGGYKLGANSANILVQDRMTGQINEERMSVYVRLGIRLLYKGLKSREMEKKRIKKLLRSLSFKQGRKYDDPASAAEIQSFINFHQLDMSEVLRPTHEFKNFNEFFYRELKPGARPCSAPDHPQIITSPADCRTVVFNKIEDAQKIWVKGREFSVERLLGNAYPNEAARYHGGALGIFRLAPQDYHRFHIPVDGIMGQPRLIEGEYYTVNPMAIRSALDVYGENVRVIVPIDSKCHGKVMVICVGAMMVGSTIITRNRGEHVHRAEELGYFKFGKPAPTQTPTPNFPNPLTSPLPPRFKAAAQSSSSSSPA